ncbi:MAG TPA: SufS family cysteine desulfurase [Acidimicrobiales bacterium]|jgi:cysteine desulfurase/selenocysteine lyase|nr:SufS family cysteine desulfurase [Acidimicrobiales bacterium]
MAVLDVESLKKDFPIFDRTVAGKPLVYLDSASSSQRPRAVLDAMDHYYETTHANVHRGVYSIAEEADALFEGARAKVARFIGAPSAKEVLFTKNVTEALNLVAGSWGRANLGPGDAVVLTEMEHHSNLVPWLILAEQKGFELRYLGIDDHGHLVLDDLERLVDGAKLVGVTMMSNVLGTITPVTHIAEVAHRAGAIVVADGAQYVPHLPTDVAALGADLVGFTGHKMLGPTGIGVLWGRRSLLEEMPPFLGGGSMIKDVRLDGFEPNELPWKFEAGTPPIAEAVGLGAAIDYLSQVGMERVRAHEVELTGYAMEALKAAHGDDVVIHGPADPRQRGGVISFSYRDVHPHDLSQVLDQAGVCVRAGHHCAKPLMRRLGVSATARASLYLYNDRSDVDTLVGALHRAADLFF